MRLKRLLVQMPWPYSPRLETFLRLPKLKAWIAKAGPHPYFANRRQIHDYVAGLAQGGPFQFFEVGVNTGDTMRYWSKLNSHPETRFSGFDSFYGLPEAWEGNGRTLPAGTYTMNGALPAIDDPRVSFIPGWFNDTMPEFVRTFRTDLPLVVHCDADLYASTLFALCTLNPLIRPGTIVLFDDFSSMLHDFRAWEDYTTAFQRTYDVLCAGVSEVYYNNVAVRVTH